MPRQSAFSSFIERFTEAERLQREGPTLKNVAENMRTLMALVAMFVAVGVLYRSPHAGIKVLALLWGAWCLTYTLLAALQAGLLFALVLLQVPLVCKVENSTTIVANVIQALFGCLVLAFMFTAVSILTASVSLVGSH
jgi:hypothetical protein